MKLLSFTLALAVACPGLLSAQSALALPQGASTAWSMPVPFRGISRAFTPPRARWHKGHLGVDLKAPAGTLVRSPAQGVVAFVGKVVDRPVVSIDHADGTRSTYEPVDPLVGAGQAVTAGQPVGTLSPQLHCERVSCLHWGLRNENLRQAVKEGADLADPDAPWYLNPLSRVQVPPVDLLPWDLPSRQPGSRGRTDIRARNPGLGPVFLDERGNPGDGTTCHQRIHLIGALV